PGEGAGRRPTRPGAGRRSPARRGRSGGPARPRAFPSPVKLSTRYDNSGSLARAALKGGVRLSAPRTGLRPARRLGRTPPRQLARSQLREDPSMLVRHATVGDADAVALAQVRAWQKAYAGIISDGYLAALDPVARARWRRSILTEPERVTATFVAVDGDAVVGYTDVGPCQEGQEAGEIYAIYVHPDHWRRGAG